jgi:hypothetical protein
MGPVQKYTETKGRQDGYTAGMMVWYICVQIKNKREIFPGNRVGCVSE